MASTLSGRCETLLINCLQVRSNFRTAITIPERAWPRLRDIIGEYLDKVEEGPGPAESGDAPAITDEAPAE